MQPAWALVPVVILATMATVIASQAVISGAYSLTRQAIQLNILPRLHVVHTSETQPGQIFMPQVNWTLLVGVLLLVLGFKSSSALASAYGVAVTGQMVVTDAILLFVMLRVWRWSARASVALIAIFLVVDLTFLAANVLEDPRGSMGGDHDRLPHDASHGHLDARHQAAFREAAKRRDAARGADQEARAEAADHRSRHRRLPDRRSAARACRPASQPQALQGPARTERDPARRHGAASRRSATTNGSGLRQSTPCS